MEYYAAIKIKEWGCFLVMVWEIVYCYWVRQGVELCAFVYERQTWEFMCYIYKEY